ncbi:MAG TPA: methionine biosynthesis protein MetW [Acidobacteriota bacterium]|nr:methionine biosynthesis protein MetW [Acidobacteriota bacterium]
MDRDETARRSEGNHAVVTNDFKAANATADILSPKPFTAPVVGSLINLLRRFGQPFVRLFLPQLARQQQFNAHVVRHMNELQKTIEELRNAAEELSRLEERFAERSEAIDRRFSEKDAEKDAAFSALSARFNEAAKVYDKIEGQIGELMALRSMLRTALERAPAASEAGRITKKTVTPKTPEIEPTSWSQLTEWMEDEDYRSFQDRFRGNPEVIAERMREHVVRFDGVEGRVADLGCGRGEFLDLLAEADIDAIGVEINATGAEECRRRGHDAVVSDLLEWLSEQKDASLGGVFMAQVIEHLAPTDWQRFVELAAAKLEAGGRLVVETINPGSLYALARAYVVDPTHIRPVHPELLSFLARRSGLCAVDVQFQAPVPDEERPTGLAFFQGDTSVEMSEELAAIREAMSRLDQICCAPQEYTLQATRPALGERA